MIPRFPVEFEQADIDIAAHVIDTDLTMVPAPRLTSTILACKHVVAHNVPGAFVECGVWRGGVSIAAKQTFERLGSDKSVFLFDTFSGMTEPQQIDRNLWGLSAIKKHKALAGQNHNQWAYASKLEVERNLAEANVDLDQVSLIAGDVLETLDQPDLLPDEIAVLRLDTDWYESTRKELEVLYPRLCVGGILLIDDYGEWQGAQAAYDEYFSDLSKRPFAIATDQSGRACIKTTQ